MENIQGMSLFSQHPGQLLSFVVPRNFALYCRGGARRKNYAGLIVAGQRLAMPGTGGKFFVKNNIDRWQRSC
jgi:hypothetical protein